MMMMIRLRQHIHKRRLDRTYPVVMELMLLSSEVGLHQTPPAIVSIQGEGENEFQAKNKWARGEDILPSHVPENENDFPGKDVEPV
jgi:hypothetical protein